ncbi:MAG TPA: HAD-IC family P-type ATPase [Thermodesulfovibrionales bacterium]|nr:HAD-IC family P-type ATPase [Thermodesulfovibrionales bacterium]
MVRTVHDAVKGRARYEVEGLYRADALKLRIESALQGHPGITGFSVSVLTSKVLVYFNSGNTAETIRSVIEEAVRGYAGNGRRSGTGVLTVATARRSVPTERSKSGVTTKEQKNNRRQIRKSVLHSEEQPAGQWHVKGTSEILDSAGVSQLWGLSRVAAGERLKRFGPNLLPESVPRSGLSIFLGQFNSLPVALLGVAAGVSIATGGIADAVVIAGVVVINSIIGYTTESQAEKTIHSLKSLVRPSALCMREGASETVPAEYVVPGDVLILRPGSYVAADARLIEVSHLSVDESALTGESMPVKKTFQPLTDEDIPLADRINMVYMGTLVTGGQGLAVVVATGRFTEIGKIQTLVGSARPPETPMERQLDRMGTQLALISGAVCAFVFLIGLLRGYGFLEMLKSSIALAVAAVPEGLPMVATTTLALGIRNMRRHNVLMRHLDAVETLGSVQTICLDKTGTITLNRMTIVSVYAGMTRLAVSDGKFRSASGDLNPYECGELLRLMHVCCLCNESEVKKEKGDFVVIGSSTENALIHLAVAAGVNVPEIREKFPLRKVMHRSENCNIMVTLHDVLENSSVAGGPMVIAVKGSPQEVLSVCSWQMKEGTKIPLTNEDREAIQIENERMAGDALRVLGVAYAYHNGGDEWPDLLESCDIQRYSDDLVWLGLTGMTDPVRDGVRELVGKFHEAGIDTVMITGDQGPTAYAIGKDLDLSRGEQLEILDSTHLNRIDPGVMKALAEKVHVFSRVSPANKLQIVQALQASGRVVAMTGDGVNDGPALKAADIGIAMGHTGTDVAREVADVVLEDDNLQTMIIAISQGRTIYNNIRKSVHFLLSTNMSEIMVMFASLTAGLGQPLNAMQLLWINLISDIAPGLALALELPEPDVLHLPPRNPEEPIVRKSDLKRIAFESMALSAGAMGAYGYGIMRYGMGAQAGTMAFMGLTLGQLLHALSCRSEKHRIFDKESLPTNRYLSAALVGSVSIQGLAIILPGLRGLLGLTPIGLGDWLVVGGTALGSLVINEATKGSEGTHWITSGPEKADAGVIIGQHRKEATA